MAPQPRTGQGLVDASGRLTFGTFDGPLARVDIDQTRFGPGGLTLPGPLRNLRLKQWQHFALIHPEALVSFAVVDVGYMKVAWCQFVDRVTDEHFEHGRRGPQHTLRLARELWDDHTRFTAPGFAVAIHNHLDAGEHVIDLAVEAAGGRPEIRGRVTFAADPQAVPPLVVCLPVGRGRGMYSHKVPGGLSGELRIGPRALTFEPGSCLGIVDVHKAHYPHHTWWRWATFAARAADGRLLALNLTKNVVADDARYNENAAWIGGALHRFGPARFEVPAGDITLPWRIATDDGRVALAFTPQGYRSERMRLPLLRSVFHQCYGRFDGTIQLGAAAGGETVAIDGAFGVAEDHDSLW